MKRENSFKWIGFLLFVLVLLVGKQSYSAEVRGVTDKVIKIGIGASLTGPGAPIAIPMNNAIRTYIRYINDKGGIHGRKVKLITEDDRYSIPAALANLKKLVYKDKVLAMIGFGGTGCIIAQFAGIEREKMPYISLSQSEIMVSPFKKYIFNCGATYLDEIKLLIDYMMKDQKASNPKIGFVTAALDFGKSGLATARERATLYGFKIVDVEYIAPGALDAGTQVLNLKMKGADHVIIHHFASAVVATIKGAKMLGYSPNFYGFCMAFTEDVIKICGESAKKFIGTHAFSCWYEDNPGIRKMREITLKYDPGTEKVIRTNPYTQGWVGALILTEGMMRAGRNLNNETLVDALEGIKNLDTEGITGIISYSPDNHKAHSYCRIYRGDVNKGIHIPITDWRRPLSAEEIQKN